MLAWRERLRTVSVQIFDHCGAATGDTALNRPDRASADRRGLLAGETAGAHENERLTLFVLQLPQSAVHVLEIESRVLRFLHDMPPLDEALIPRPLPPRAPPFRIELIA